MGSLVSSLGPMVVGGPPDVARVVARACGRLGIDIAGVDPDHEADGEVTSPGALASPFAPAADPAAWLERARATAVHPGAARGEERRDLARLAAETGTRFLGCPPAVDEALRDPAGFAALVETTALRPLPPSVARGDGDDDEDAAHPLTDGRRIETLLVRDAGGDARVIGHRETSIRDGDVPWIRECPAPFLVFHGEGEAIAGALADAALRLAEAAGLVGLGTFDFAIDAGGRIHCVAARTGIEPDQADVELVFGVDLVEAELRCFLDEPLPDEIELARPSGAAVQAALHTGAAGLLERLRFPPVPTGKVRIVADRPTGGPVPAGRLAAITAHGPVRHRAIHLLDRVLAETAVGPVPTNLRILRRTLNDASFHAGQYDVGFTTRLAAAPPNGAAPAAR